VLLLLLLLLDLNPVQANYLTPDYYEDVTDERFCVRLCGYPLCSTELQSVPAQRYKISTRDNKVYDISERKVRCPTHI
jgi:hypothetical protein